MTNLGKYLQIIFDEQEFYNDDFINFIQEHFEVVACDYTENGLEQYVVYENIGFDEEAFLDSVKLAKINLPKYEFKICENKNWLTENVIKFAPIEVDDFLIYGIHEQEQPKTDKIPIQIYAATAFGSEHQTTKGCLEAISWLNNHNAKTDKILDVGCGSGILSIACAKLWKDATTVFAVDIDEESVFVTEQNCVTNKVDELIQIKYSNGYSSDFVQENAPYDVIMSNILARPLIDMSEDLYKSLNIGGFCILSGFVDNQLDWVVGAHTKLGLKQKHILEIDNWRAVIMEK